MKKKLVKTKPATKKKLIYPPHNGKIKKNPNASHKPTPKFGRHDNDHVPSRRKCSPGHDKKPVAICHSAAKKKKKLYLIAELKKRGVIVAQQNFRYAEIMALAREYGIDTDHKHWTPELREQVKCQNRTVPGAEVCVHHGGNAQQVIKMAKQRLGEMVMPALEREMAIIRTSKQHGPVVAAIKDVLDRCGLKEAYKIKIEGGDGKYDVKNLDSMSEEEIVTLVQLLKKLKSPGGIGLDNAINVTPSSAVGVAVARMFGVEAVVEESDAIEV